MRYLLHAQKQLTTLCYVKKYNIHGKKDPEIVQNAFTAFPLFQKCSIDRKE